MSRSGVDQEKSANQRQRPNYWATPPYPCLCSDHIAGVSRFGWEQYILLQ